MNAAVVAPVPRAPSVSSHRHAALSPSRSIDLNKGDVCKNLQLLRQLRGVVSYSAGRSSSHALLEGEPTYVPAGRESSIGCTWMTSISIAGPYLFPSRRIDETGGGEKDYVVYVHGDCTSSIRFKDVRSGIMNIVSYTSVACVHALAIAWSTRAS